jgi:hypothetical protein
MSLVCLIFGHRWVSFHAEQCPLEYRVCNRCDRFRHVCNKIGANQ